MFDTHAHLNFPDYDKDREEVIKRCLDNNIFVINVGTNLKESKAVLSLAERYDKGVYASVGLHPLYTEEGFTDRCYRELAENKKVVAIGETGLDHKYIKNDKGDVAKAQEDIFRKHITLARELKLPLILHCRMAHRKLISILKDEVKSNKKIKGVLHCFSGSVKEAREYLELGLYIGVNGIIFKMNLKEALKLVPLERMVLETDCPFLSPKKEVKRNEPLFLDVIAEKVAEMREEEKEKIVAVTTKNVKELFEI